MRRRKKRGQNCRDKTLFIIIIIILFSSRAKRLLIIVHYVCCGDGDGSPIGKKKHYHRLLLLLLFPRVSNVRAGERQSRRSRCVVVAVVVSGFDLSFFPFSREKPLSRLALVSLLPLLFGKMMIVFFSNLSRAEYIHAKEMYAIRDISSPKLIYGMGIAGGVAFAASIPIFAVNFQQAKGG